MIDPHLGQALGESSEEINQLSARLGDLQRNYHRLMSALLLGAQIDMNGLAHDAVSLQVDRATNQWHVEVKTHGPGPLPPGAPTMIEE